MDPKKKRGSGDLGFAKDETTCSLFCMPNLTAIETSRMTAHQAKRIRNLIDTMARQLEAETDPAKRFELKRAIRAGEIKLTTG